MKFFIVDNELLHLTRLQSLLKSCCPAAAIWPPDEKVFSSWKEVSEKLASETSAEDLIVILDLGLESENMPSVRAGVEQAYGLRSLRTHAVFVAYTQWPDAAETCPHYSEVFNALIDKQRLMGYDTIEQQQLYIKQMISRGIRVKHDAKPEFTRKDSLGLRLAAAAFGEQIFDFLVQEVAESWKEVEISALTSGHSGAFILSISGIRQGGAQRLIVKCARNAALIRPDIQVGDFLAELGPLAEILAPLEQQLHPFPDKVGFYYRQAEIKGETILELLRSHPWDEKTKQTLDALLSVEIRCYSRLSNEPFGSEEPARIFPLSVIDRGRALDSIEFLGDLGHLLREKAQWPSMLPEPAPLCKAMSTVIETWDSIVGGEKELLCVGQHGDLNPGNVLVPAVGKVLLIDLARRGRWPVGYDISRLATMLRIRLTGATRGGDWIENRLSDWFSDEFASVDRDVHAPSGLCPAADYCDQMFRIYLQSRAPTQRDHIIRGYKLAALWDLIKVISYADLSPFKRLWAFGSCWRLARNLGFVQ